MLATLQLAATKSDRTKGEISRPGNINSIFLLSDPKLTKALNTVSLEEQEPGDLVDADALVLQGGAQATHDRLVCSARLAHRFIWRLHYVG